MQKITNVAELKTAIQQLEYQQANEHAILKAQFYNTCESLKLSNIIKSTFKEVVSIPDLKTNIVNTAIGLTTGFVAKKLLIGKTHNPLSKLLGFIVEMVVAGKVTKNAEEIKSTGRYLFKKKINQDNDPEKV